jgi:putative redox protein
MEMIVNFSGGLKVDTHFDEFTIRSDQPEKGGGENSAPSPFLIFLASIGNCVGFYVLSFCKKHDLPIDGIQIIQRMHSNPTSHMVESIDLEIQIPASFPPKYYEALVRTAELCKVKQHIANPPIFNTYTLVVDGQ